MAATQPPDDVESAPLTAEPVAAPRRRPRALVVVLALVVLVVAPLSLLEVEVELLQLKSSAAVHRLHSYLRGSVYGAATKTIDCATKDQASYQDACIAPLLALGEFTGPETTLYAEEIFQVDWSEVVSRADVLHLGTLQRACTTHSESIIPWDVGLDGADVNAGLVNRTDDQALVDALRKCPSFDIYIPSGLRGQGYCEDAAAYTKYAHARMLPRWVFDNTFFDKTLDRAVTYHELCPRTPVLMLNHYWDGLRDQASWPKTKPLFLMPNIEMYEISADHLWLADAVLCKTVLCADYVSQWFQQQGNPRLARVLYTRHTSSDVATGALVASGAETSTSDWSKHARTKRKDFKTPAFIHTAGGSSQKGTAHVLDCWLARPDLPRLDLYMRQDLYDRLFRKRYDARLQSDKFPNVKLHLGGLSAEQFGTMIADTSFFLCPSLMEGYGHYINQARAAGGLIITPDVPPMNELVTPESGALMAARRDASPNHFLGGSSKHELSLRNVTGFVSRFSGRDLCAAVDRVLTQTDERARVAKGERARQQYLYDTAFFAHEMRVLREALRPSEAHDRSLRQ